MAVDPFESRARKAKRLLGGLVWTVTTRPFLPLLIRLRHVALRHMIEDYLEPGERVLATDYEITLSGAGWVATDRALYATAGDKVWWPDSIDVRRYPYSWIESIDEVSRGEFRERTITFSDAAPDGPGDLFACFDAPGGEQLTEFARAHLHRAGAG